MWISGFSEKCKNYFTLYTESVLSRFKSPCLSGKIAPEIMLHPYYKLYTPKSRVNRSSVSSIPNAGRPCAMSDLPYLILNERIISRLCRGGSPSFDNSIKHPALSEIFTRQQSCRCLHSTTVKNDCRVDGRQSPGGIGPAAGAMTHLSDMQICHVSDFLHHRRSR